MFTKQKIESLIKNAKNISEALDEFLKEDEKLVDKERLLLCKIDYLTKQRDTKVDVFANLMDIKFNGWREQIKKTKKTFPSTYTVDIKLTNQEQITFEGSRGLSPNVVYQKVESLAKAKYGTFDELEIKYITFHTGLR